MWRVRADDQTSRSRSTAKPSRLARRSAADGEQVSGAAELGFGLGEGEGLGLGEGEGEGLGLGEGEGKGLGEGDEHLMTEPLLQTTSGIGAIGDKNSHGEQSLHTNC
jgi:hypothetical protein